MSLFTKWIDTSSFEKIFAGSSRHSITGTFSSDVSVSRRQVWSRVWDRIAIISFYSARSKIIAGSCPENVTAVILSSQLIESERRIESFPNIYSISISTSHWRVTLTLHYDSYRRDLLLSVCVDHYKIFTSFSTLRCQVRSSSSGKYTMQYANHLRIRIFIFRIHEHFPGFLLWVSVSVMDSQVVTFNFFYPFRRLEDNYIDIN